MRVLQLGKYYEPYLGGMETHVRLLAEGLAARGVAVEVLVHNTGSKTVKESVRGVHVTRVGRVATVMSTELAPRLRKELSRPYDLLHLHAPHPMGMFAYLSARTPPHRLVVTHHSDVVRQSRLRSLLSPMFETVMRRADAIISSSQAYLESSPELRSFRSKVSVIPFGIDLSRYSPDLRGTRVAREVRRIYGNRVILTTGRLIYYKGLDVLLKAMVSVRGHLLVAGEGPLRKTLEQQAKTLGVSARVTFLGALPADALEGYYGAADVFVLPSIARSEAFGIVQIEALACAIPVVNTALESGVPFVSPHGTTGLTVPPNDPAALAAALSRILDDPSLANRFGTEGRQRAVGLFTAERMVDDTLKLYGRLTPGERTPPRVVTSME